MYNRCICIAGVPRKRNLSISGTNIQKDRELRKVLPTSKNS